MPTLILPDGTPSSTDALAIVLALEGRQPEGPGCCPRRMTQPAPSHCAGWRLLSQQNCTMLSRSDYPQRFSGPNASRRAPTIRERAAGDGPDVLRLIEREAAAAPFILERALLPHRHLPGHVLALARRRKMKAQRTTRGSRRFARAVAAPAAARGVAAPPRFSVPPKG